MKKFKSTIFLFAAFSVMYSGQAQVAVDITITAEDLVNNYLLGDGVTATNITFNEVPGDEANVQLGLYTGPSDVVSFDEGLVMGTYNVTAVAGEIGGGTTNAIVDDPDLVAISGFNSNDGAILEFDFIATSDSVRFNYVFASNEYPGYTCTTFNDAFGFFLSGPGISGPYTNDAINIALIPNSDIGVAINTVNGGVPTGGGTVANCEAANPNWVEDSQYFVDNGGLPSGDVQFPGMTVTLTAKADVECGGLYHIKLAIGDAVDGSLDSGVFIEAGSFASFGEVFVNVSPSIGGVTITDPQYQDVIVAGCSDFEIELTRPEGLPVDSVFVVFGGTATENVDYLLGENDTLFFFPDGVDTLNFAIETLWSGNPGLDTYLTVMVIFPDGCGVYDTAFASMPFVDPYELESSAQGIELICPTDIVEVSAQGSNGINPYIYDWGDGLMGPEVVIPDPPEPGQQAYYVVGISDACEFEVLLDSVLIINSIQPPLQSSIAPFEQPTCPNEPVVLQSVVVDGAPNYSYVWSTLNGSPISTQETATAQFVFDTDVTLLVIDACNTIVRDTITILYPQFDSLLVSFPPLVNNCPSSPVALTAEYTGGSGEPVFIWTILEGEGEFVQPQDQQNTEVIPSSGMNIYSVTVTDRCYNLGYFGLTPGIATFEDSLRTIDLSDLPNVITPNDDNKNEFFVIKGIEEFSNARLEIFDRWGKLVFETDNYEAGLSSGNYENAFNAKDLEDGTYFYVIDVENGECTQSGTLQVLRSDD